MCLALLPPGFDCLSKGSYLEGVGLFRRLCFVMPLREELDEHCCASMR